MPFGNHVTPHERMVRPMANDSLLSTWVSATFHPAALHADRPSGPRRWGPVAFALVVGAVVTPASAFVEALVEHRTVSDALLAALGWLIASPFITLFSVVLGAAIIHFWLLMVRGNKGTFRDTVAAVCYARAPEVFVVVPVLGAVVGYVWSLVALCIGLKRAQRTTTGRAVFAVLAGVLGPVMVALGLRCGVVEAYKIPSGSMIPLTMMGDHIFISKLAYGPLLPGTDIRLFSRLPPRRGEIRSSSSPRTKSKTSSSE